MFGRKHRARERQARAAEIAAFDAVTNRQGIADWLRENMDLEEGPVSERREPLRGEEGDTLVAGDGWAGHVDADGVFFGAARDDAALADALVTVYGRTALQTPEAERLRESVEKTIADVATGDHNPVEYDWQRKAEGGILHLPEHLTFLDSGACTVPGVSIDDKTISEEPEDEARDQEDREAFRRAVEDNIVLTKRTEGLRWPIARCECRACGEPEGEPEDEPVEKIVDFAGEVKIEYHPPQIATLRAHETPLLVAGAGPGLMAQACDRELEATPLTDLTMRAYWIVLGDRYRALAEIVEKESLDESEQKPETD